MSRYVHMNKDNRIDSRKDELYEEAELSLGWMEWPFDEPVPDKFWEYAIRDGELIHVGEEPISEEGLRAIEVIEAQESLPETTEGLLEIARMTADHETSIEDLENAIIELAALIGGE